MCKDTPASKAAPTDARLQVIQAPVQFPPTSNRAEPILSNGEWFLRLGGKRHSSFPLVLSLISYSWDAGCHVMRWLKQPYGEVHVASCQQPAWNNRACEGDSRKVDHPVPLEGCSNLGWRPYCSLTRTPAPHHPAEPLSDSWSTDTVGGNTCLLIWDYLSHIQI